VISTLGTRCDISTFARSRNSAPPDREERLNEGKQLPTAFHGLSGAGCEGPPWRERLMTMAASIFHQQYSGPAAGYLDFALFSEKMKLERESTAETYHRKRQWASGLEDIRRDQALIGGRWTIPSVSGSTNQGGTWTACVERSKTPSVGGQA